MFYRIVSLCLVVLGVFHLVSGLTWPLTIGPESLEKSAVGLASIFLGLLNFGYFYERPESKLPRITLLAANLLFIGFAILMITSSLGVTFGYIALVLSLINCIMVLNHTV